MISVEELSRRYGDFTAVQGVSFDIGKGEIVGLLGHNGAGKTTIMKMLTGFIEPSGGAVKVQGHDVQSDPEQIQQVLGYLPENLPVYPEMTVLDYLDYCADLRGIPEAQKLKAIQQAIEKTELQAKLLNEIGTLSRGYKQRVGVAQAILHQPQLLILDEPTNGLDPHQTQQMRRLIKELAKEATVILSTHIMQEVDALCDRVLMMKDGQLAVNATLEELKRSDQIELQTSLTQVELQQELEQLSQSVEVISAESLPPFGFRYVLKHQQENPSELICKLTRQLCEAGAEIYSVQPLKRDLETLFKEVNDITEAHYVH